MKIKTLKYIFGLLFCFLFFFGSINSYVSADQFSPVRITKESRDGRLYLMISSDIPNANDYCSSTYLNLVTATGNGNTLPLHRTNTASTSTTCKQEVHTDVFTGDITVSVAAGFFEAEDDDGNVYAESPAGGPITFHWEADITGPDIQQHSWTGNNLVVEVSYELVGISSPGINCGVPGKFEIVGGTLTNASSIGSLPMCRLFITTESNEVTVNVQPGVIVGEGMESGPGLQTFTKPQDCETPKVGNSGCDETYGPSYSLSGTCCVTQCSTPQKVGGGCNDASHIVDGNGCCVQNSCQYPPLTGTDCSNQFGGRGVYSGAIQCCVDNGSCSNAPTNGQCSGNLVLDSAGQCCITCEHPINSSGNCTEPGFTAQGNCCFADDMCGSGVNAGGECQQCTGDTIANESHTKCICDSSKKCCGIQLNTVVPFIGDCIEMNTDSSRGDTTSVTSVTAFPILVQGLMKILMSAIMVFSFLMVIIAGLSMITGAFGGSGYNKGKTIIKNVIISLILLGCSGLILSLINPSFFGG